jgi:hypothetical protein
VRLDYQRDPGAERCPKEQAFRDAAGANMITSAPLFAPDAAARLTVILRRRGYGYEGTATIYDAAGAELWTRALPPPSYPPSSNCSSLMKNLALSATNEIDPAVPVQLAPLPVAPPVAKPSPCPVAVVPAVEACQQVTSPPEPPEPSPWPPAPIAPPLSSPSPPLPEGPRFQAGLASVFAIGAAPSVVGGIGGFIGVRWPKVSLALEGRALFAPSATIAGAQVRDGYRFDFAALSGTGCYHPASWAFVCGRAEGGSLSASKSGVTFTTNSARVVGFGIRFGSERTVTSWLAIRAYFEVLGEPSATRFGTTSGNLTFWNHPTVYGSVGLGPVFTFPGT